MKDKFSMLKEIKVKEKAVSFVSEYIDWEPEAYLIGEVLNMSTYN